MTTSRRLTLKAALVLAMGMAGLFGTAQNAGAAGSMCWGPFYYECRSQCPFSDPCTTCSPDPGINLQCEEGTESCPGQFKAFCGWYY